MSSVKPTDNVAFAEAVDATGDSVRIVGYKDAVNTVRRLPVGKYC